MSKRKAVLNEAESHIGYVETPNNRTKFGKWYGLDGKPWCAMFVSYCMNQAGAPLPSEPSRRSAT